MAKHRERARSTATEPAFAPIPSLDEREAKQRLRRACEKLGIDPHGAEAQRLSEDIGRGADIQVLPDLD